MTHRMAEQPEKLKKVSASLKYDILSALAVAALSQKDRTRIDYFRLIALITSRYDWLRGEVSIGHSQLAELWSIDVRSVKRQIALYADAGLLHKNRAGVRGRVTVYKIDLLKLISVTRPAFAKVGPDLEERMSYFFSETMPSESAIASTKSRSANLDGPDSISALSEDFQHSRTCYTEPEDGPFLAALQSALSPSAFHRWFSDVKIRKVSPTSIELLFARKFNADYVEKTFEKHLTKVTSECFGSQYRWKIRVNDATTYSRILPEQKERVDFRPA